jgi:hypothetical protein
MNRDEICNRDFGICAICGIDTTALSRALFKAICSPGCGLTVHEARSLEAAMYEKLVKAHRPDEVPFDGTMWEADHILPRAEGGSDDPSNLRTLCVECHRMVTLQLRHRLKHKGRCADGDFDPVRHRHEIWDRFFARLKGEDAIP